MVSLLFSAVFGIFCLILFIESLISVITGDTSTMLSRFALSRNRPLEGNRVPTQPHHQPERSLRGKRAVLAELASPDAAGLLELRCAGGVRAGPRGAALEPLHERRGLSCLLTNTPRIGSDGGKTGTNDGLRDAPAKLPVLENHEGRVVRQRARGGSDVHRHGHGGGNRVEDWVGAD